MRWDTTRNSRPSIFRSEKFWIACIAIGIIGFAIVVSYNPSSSSSKPPPPPVVCYASNGCFQGQINATSNYFQFHGKAGNVTIDNGSNKTFVKLYVIDANYTGAVRFSFLSNDTSTRILLSFKVTDMNSTQYFTSTCYSAPAKPCIVGPGTLLRIVTIQQPWINFNINHVCKIDIVSDQSTITQYVRLHL